MKTLYLIGHAKSSWAFQQLDDFNRPLGLKGRKDVRKMAQFAARHIPAPELIISSSASRAFYTALFMADEWEYEEEKIALEPALYHADEEETLEVIREYGAEQSIIAIVGHNPGLTDVYNILTGDHLDNLPTSGIASIAFNIDEWDEIGLKPGEKKFIYTPKNL
jgi:phosphohistidine phosphatase